MIQSLTGYKINFVQDNESKSTKGVFRGLHYQLSPHAQSKLVRVNEGSVLDVVVDLRKSSSTFGKHLSTVLSSENKFQLFIPRGFAHGFVVLSDTADFEYKCTDYYDPSDEGSILWDDPDLDISWPIEYPKLSSKDASAPKLVDLKR